MHRTSLRTVAAFLAGALLVGGVAGCGGDDGDDFCGGIEDVVAKGEALTAIELETPEDLEPAKEALTEFIDALEDVLEAAPDEIADQAAVVVRSISVVRERVEEADTIEELQWEVPELVGLLTDELNAEDELSKPLIEYAVETCPEARAGA